MDLSDISTNKGVHEWENFLMDKSKEELVELVIEKMCADVYFFKTVQAKFIKFEGSVDELVRIYCDEVDYEMSNKVPNVEYLEMISRNILEKADDSNDLLFRFKICMTIVEKLKEAIHNGAGYFYENEFLLDELIAETEMKIQQLITNKISYLNRLI